MNSRPSSRRAQLYKKHAIIQKQSRQTLLTLNLLGFQPTDHRAIKLLTMHPTVDEISWSCIRRGSQSVHLRIQGLQRNPEGAEILGCQVMKLSKTTKPSPAPVTPTSSAPQTKIRSCSFSTHLHKAHPSGPPKMAGTAPQPPLVVSRLVLHKKKWHQNCIPSLPATRALVPLLHQLPGCAIKK